MTIQINSLFDGGNIVVESLDHTGNIDLSIKPDVHSEFLQWFHFRLSGAKGVRCNLSIVNAGSTTYPKGWENYDVATSEDLKHWYRTPACFDQASLSWSITPTTDSVYFAYFAPYSLDRHQAFLAECTMEPGVSLEVLGQTLDGRDLDYLCLQALNENRKAQEKLQLWCIGRQHPGETMASWWMEGWLNRLLDESDATACALREIADIHVVPNMNPDGSFRGHLRTNACGANLNREWAKPSMERSPEVFLVRQRMRETGVSLCIDVHGDEALPYNFIAGTEGVSNWNQQRDQQLNAFKETLAAINPDFQTVYGYPKNSPNSANLSFCSNSVAEYFECPAYTLEMPFKDNAERPDKELG